MNYAAPQKTAILADLQALVTAGTLQQVFADDYSKLNPLDRNITATPCAVVLPPLVQTSEYEDQATNRRTYTWYILVAVNSSNTNGQTTLLENLMDSVLNAFDADCTLQGTSDAAVLPAILEPPGIISAQNVSYATFYVVLKASKLVPAGVQ